jgi:PAS domain S-box-containing protein
MSGVSDPFRGEGEVRAMGRGLNWSATSLGEVGQWPGTLRDMVRTALESPFPIALWCGPELLLVYNDAYRAVLGAKHPSALGQPGPRVWAEIWDGIAPLFDRIRAGGPPVFREDAPFVVRRAGAEVDPADENRPNAWFTFSLSPVRDKEGEIVAFLNLVAESTRRVLAEREREAGRAEARRAEARLREVFAQAPAFMAVLRGPDHVFEYVNTAYHQLVGHRELLGLPVMEALPEIRGQGFEELLHSVLATGEPFVGREVSVMISRTPDSEPEERFVDLVYYPITEADGTRSGVVAHGSDVTQHVLDRLEAQRARIEAEHANRAKSQFLATMSHEIRTPINAVMGYADLLDAGIGGPLTEKQREYVDSIRTGSRHLRSLVSDVLDLAKIEAGEMLVSVDDVPVRPAVQWALQIIGPQAEDRELTMVVDWRCGGETRILADEDRVRQVLLNLLSNAVKFTEAGGTVTVRCRESETAPPDAALPEVGPWVAIEVEDTGRGVPAREAERIFEPFVQADGAHTRLTRGTGLGLTISRRLARLMGGELTVRSEAGAGSTFSLWVAPAAQERLPSSPGDDDATVWPPEAHQLAGLAPAGQTLIAALERVEQEWVDRLRSDRFMRPMDGLNRAKLADHSAPLVAAIAHALVALEESGTDPGLVRDAEVIQSTIALRHGHQRRRLGWARGEVEREYGILAEVLDATLRREAPRRTAANLSTALAVVHRLVGRAAAASLSVYE